MATCNFCGEWAGLFRNEHDACKAQVARLSLQLSARAAASAAGLPPASGIAMAGQVEAAAEAPAFPAIVFHPQPETLLLTRAVLRHCGIQDEMLARAFDEEIARLVSGGLTERDLVRWAAAPESSARMHSLPAAALTVMFHTVAARHASLRRTAEMASADFDAVFPYKKIDSYACFVPGHRDIDQFTAGRRDRIWTMIDTPFDWWCSCTISLAASFDVEEKGLAGISGTYRFPKGALNRFRTWTNTAPPPPPWR